jgi:hypothetical protein
MLGMLSVSGSGLTCDAFAVHGGHVLELGLLNGVARDRAARQRPVGREGSVYVADAVASGCRAVHPLELHGGGRGDDGLVLLDGAARFKDPHFVPISYRTARGAASISLPHRYSLTRALTAAASMTSKPRATRSSLSQP